MTKVRFDNSLPLMIKALVEELGDKTFEGAFLRDATGRLAYFFPLTLSARQKNRLGKILLEALGPYARPDRVFADASDLGAEEVLADRSALSVEVDGHRIRLLDRRLVGADWLTPPVDAVRSPSRFVFSSLKGGVGRSTALSIAAVEQASRGKRVLAIDLDLEAPGLGAMLLNHSTLPKFGTLDALVEDSISGFDEEFIADLVGPSPIAAQMGRIDVMPAFGSASLENPRNALAKIARAYSEDIDQAGVAHSLLQQVKDLVGTLETHTRYDAVLVDTRAGLHETTAAAVLGLGAEVFLFGLDEPQTFQGYLALFAHLSQFLPSSPGQPEWLERLIMVQGKAPADAEDRQAFAEKVRDLYFSSGLYRLEGGAAPIVTYPASPFHNVPWDNSQPDEGLVMESPRPPDPIAVLDDQRFRHFDPLLRRDVVNEAVYKVSYGSLLSHIDEVMSGVRAED